MDAVLLVDAEALRRGHAEPGETCEIAGVGPVPVSVARDVFGESLLSIVIRRGVAVQTVVHTGRVATEVQRTALFVQQLGRCIDDGCDRRMAEADHITPYTIVRETALPNLAGRCRPCHRRKTLGESYERPPPSGSSH